MSNGADVWSRLGDQKLRQSLDKESFQIIQPLLPVIDQVPLPLREDMQRLGLIYSFLNAEQLFKPSFRKEIFNCLYENELQDLAGLLSIDEWQRDEIIKVMVKIPFGPNPKARVISQFLGVPDWLLDLHDEAVSDPPTQSIPWPVKYQALSKQNSDAAMEYNYAGRRPFKRLKSYQNRVYSEALEFLNKNNSRLILNMPTGTGKTRTCMELVCAFLSENPTKSVVWLADKVELIDQACLEFHDTWEYLGDREVPIQRWVKSNPIADEGRSEFICATFGTLLSRGEGLKKINIGLVVVDEAHMAVAEKWREKMENTVIQLRNSTRVIGLTATPMRTASGESEKLVDWFQNNRLVIREQGNSNLIDWLETNEYLSLANVDTVTAEVEMELTAAERKKLNEVDGDFSKAFLKKLASKVKFNSVIVNKLENLLREDPGRRILYFGTTVQQSKMVMCWLRMKGYSAFHIDGGTDKTIRKSGIEAFREGRLQVLCNYGVLTTGFDAPLIDVVVIARPTSSGVTYHQMVGRGLRGPKLGGTRQCLIIDVDFNLQNHGSKRRQLYSYYRDLWSESDD
jgi:DNA repair protein RadD